MAGRNPSPSKRGNVVGWSPAAVRRHTKWLYSIDVDQLDGDGYAVTLTLRNTPDSAAEFHAARRAWIMRATRLGAHRIHWVIEWQRRGTPHIHAAVYFPPGQAPENVALQLLAGWVMLVPDEWGAQLSGQYYDRITGASGWLKYLSKHASRGVRHYQRNGKPDGWEKTGRLWGHGGEWPAELPMRHDMSREAYWRYRRLVRSWRIADARASGDASRIKYARRMLSCPDPRLSAVRGVSDWIPEGVSMGFLALLSDEGFELVGRVD
jgi:hypothetical protein